MDDTATMTLVLADTRADGHPYSATISTKVRHVPLPDVIDEATVADLVEAFAPAIAGMASGGLDVVAYSLAVNGREVARTDRPADWN